MTITSIQAFRQRPTPASDIALIHISSVVEGLAQEISIDHNKDGFHSISTVQARSIVDAQSVVESFHHNLDFCIEEVSVAVYSDCEAVLAEDVAYLMNHARAGA